MQQKTVTYLSTLLFIVALGIAYYTGLSQRTVEVYSCTYSYEVQGMLDYADRRYYARGIECLPGTDNTTCIGRTGYDGNKMATERDIQAYERSADGSFYDGFSFRNISITK